MSPTSPAPPSDTVAQDYFLGKEVVEVPLLLPGWQAAALEEAAHARGLTAAQMVRGLIQDFFGKFVQANALRPRRIETDAESEYRHELLGSRSPAPAEPPAGEATEV